MTFRAWYLAAAALIAGAFAVAYLVRTSAMARVVGMVLPTAAARADYRAIYGGSQLGVAAFLALCAARPAWVAPGLLAAGLYAAGFGLARAGSLAADRAWRDWQWLVAALETLAGAVAVGLAR